MDSPAPASLTLTGAGCSLRVYDYGEEGAPALVLLHGMEDFALALEPLAEAFREQYRVLVPDLRGHGDSDKPGIYSHPHFAADLHALILQLGLERPVLVGHSLGGQIACQYAGIFSDVAAAVANVDGLGPPIKLAEPDAEEKQWRTREGVESLLREPSHGRPMMGVEDAAQLYLRYHPRLDPATAMRIAELGTEPHPHGGLRWKWDPRVHSLRLFSTPELVEERYGWITCPVLLVSAGEIDEFMWRRRGLDPASLEKDPAEIERRVGLFRDATHVEIAEAGHHVHYDAPDELVRVLREFLATVQ